MANRSDMKSEQKPVADNAEQAPKKGLKRKFNKLINVSGAAAEKMADSLPARWDDAEFLQDVRLATLRGAHPASKLLFWTLIALISLFFVWASFAQLDEVTRGSGQVIPSSRVQMVQNLEGGIIEEILVQDGGIVEAGQPLLIIDDTGFASDLAEKETRYLTLLAVIARLQAEINDRTSVTFPPEVRERAPEIARQAQDVHEVRMQEIRANLAVLERQYEQKQQEQRELNNQLIQERRNYELAREELDITAPLEAEGAVSRVEVLRLRRQVNELQGKMEASELAIPRAELAVKEAKSRLDEAQNKIKRETRAELLERQDEADRVAQTLTAVEDQVDRATVRSPVKGIVNQVLVGTVGGVIQPGMDLIEIIPLEDSLLVEAQVRPQDIAFIRPGQAATVKLSAYDFSIYGGLEAELVHISADTITNENDETFYKIRVRTDRNYLGNENNPLPIIPGMIATVDILTGKKTVMQYILKPFNKVREAALGER